MNNLVDTYLGQYHLLEIIGKGGMATVFRAHQENMNRDVAIKIISPDLAIDAEFMARFEREAQIIARLQHPHILPVYDFGHQKGLTYLVMRLMEGGSLADELRAGQISNARIIELAQQMASALDYAHMRGIVHRDLKPTNILLDNDRNAYLTDFGIAKLLSGGPTTGLTSTGAVMGTPTYMAPEQWRAEPVDGRTDIYALGVILYLMLAGQVPFHAETPHGLMYQHLDMSPPAPRTINPSLPATVEPILAKALAKRREDRYASATDLARDLEVALSAPSPRRLPEQTDFEAQFAERKAAQNKPSVASIPDIRLPDRVGQDSRPTVPPTGQGPAQPPIQPTIPAPAAAAPPPARTIQAPPPVYTPPPQPLYHDPALDQPPVYTPPEAYHHEYPPEDQQAMLGRTLWIGAAVLTGVLVLIGIIVLIMALSNGGGDSNTTSQEPTVPRSTAAPTPLFRPSAVVQSPANGTAVNLGDPVTITFAANFAQGTITRVELRRFGQVLDTINENASSVTGTFTYSPDSTGTHNLEVVPWAGDVRGDSATVSIYAQ